MVRALAILLLGLGACGGPSEETLIDELRVVASIPSTPEVAPGEAFGVQVTIADPSNGGFDALTWMCTTVGPPGSPCLESQRGNTAGWVSRVDAEGTAQDLVVDAAVGGLLMNETEEVRTTLWTLTCEPGECSIISGAPGLTSRDSAWTNTLTELSDPTEALKDRPLEGVSLARRSIVISNREPSSRNRHPRLLEAPSEPVSAAPNSSSMLTIGASDEEQISAFAYATLGGFGQPETAVEAETVALEWFPGTESTEGQSADLFVVFTDGRGGETVWTGQAEVGAP